jgi:coenzyme F420-reducing hydrogenase beta subunit
VLKKVAKRIVNKVLKCNKVEETKEIKMVPLAERGYRVVTELDKTDCCGCGACFNICPFGAISMTPDSEGFLYPLIDDNKCTDCGLCIKTCPTVNIPSGLKNNEPNCYVAWADDQTRSVSSSGGMFSVFSNKVLEDQGVVYGAGFTPEMKVEQMGVKSKEDLAKLRGSKYVQSDASLTYQEVKDLLEGDKAVLYSGCPCQIAGLNAFLGKDYDNLLTIGLLCHGGPSPKVFQKYLNEIHGDKEIASLSFRDKTYHGWTTEMTVRYKDGTNYISRRGLDPFLRAFIPAISTRPHCSQCAFATLPRQADITLGDFWGVQKLNKKYSDGKGTSIMIVNSVKGENALAEIRTDLNLCDSVPLDYVKTIGQPLEKPYRAHPVRNRFFNLLDTYSFKKALTYSTEHRYDVGVIGLWYGRNYGSMITYYSLHRYLTQLGLSVLMINNPLGNNSPNYSKTHPKRFARELYNISMKRPLHKMRELNKHCDSFIVGSDQLWNYGLSAPYGQLYFLEFVDDENKKIAYGTSFGKDQYKGPDTQKERSINNLKRFDAISVREDFAVDMCRDIFGVESTKVMDPVFFTTMEEYSELIKEVNWDRKDFIFSYILDPTLEKTEALKHVTDKFDLEMNIVLDELPLHFEENKRKTGITEDDVMLHICEEVDVKEWLYNFYHAKFIVTDSFHGCCMSLIFKKPFIVIKNSKRGGLRFKSLLAPLGLANRIVNDPAEIINSPLFTKEIDYKQVYEKLDEQVEFSKKWLERALFSDKKLEGLSSYKKVDIRK